MGRKKVTEAFCVMIISLEFVYILTINLFVYLHFDKTLFNLTRFTTIVTVKRVLLFVSNYDYQIKSCFIIHFQRSLKYNNLQS